MSLPEKLADTGMEGHRSAADKAHRHLQAVNRPPHARGYDVDGDVIPGQRPGVQGHWRQLYALVHERQVFHGGNGGSVDCYDVKGLADGEADNTLDCKAVGDYGEGTVWETASVVSDELGIFCVCFFPSEYGILYLPVQKGQRQCLRWLQDKANTQS